MAYECFPDMIRGIYFPDAESYHKFMTDMDYGLLDDDELETWLAWPRRATPAAPPPPAPAPAPGKLLSVADAAEYAGISTKRIRELVRKRKIRSVRHSKASNAHMNIVRVSLDDYVQRGGQ